MTGAPLLQCKTVLTDCDGDIDKAKGILREKNLIFADKKAGANAGEGVALRTYAALGLPFDSRSKKRSACQPQR